MTRRPGRPPPPPLRARPAAARRARRRAPGHGLVAGLGLVACLLLAPGSAGARGVMHLDRAVAVVGDQVVTRSEVEIARLLAAHDRDGLAVLAPPAGDDADDDRVERWWVQQVVLRQLAGDVDVYQPGPAELRGRLQAVEQALVDDDRWPTLQHRLGLDRAGLEAWVRDRLVVERFVLRNIGALGRRGEVTEVSADRYADWLAQVQGGIRVRRIPPIGEEP